MTSKGLIDSENEGTLTQEMDLGLSQDLEFMKDDSIPSSYDRPENLFEETWVSSSKKKKERKKSKAKVVIAGRASSRVANGGVSMMEKAIKRAQDKDAIPKGTSSSNQFLVLNSLDNEYIHDVATKLDLEIVNVDTQIEVFKAEERVRAALAEANYKEYLASLNRKTAP